MQSGELDQALAGAVDLTSDLRSLAATDAVHPYSRTGQARPFDVGADGAVPGEGAVAVVLKRLEDAQRDGDRVYAVIRGIGAGSGGGAEAYRNALKRAYAEAEIDPATVGYLEASGAARVDDDQIEAEALDAFFTSDRRTTACRLGSASGDIGHTGAASGLVSVVKAALALHHEIIPALRGMRKPVDGLVNSKSISLPAFPQYWVRNRAEGPRRAGVSSVSVDGNCMHVVLEACEQQSSVVRMNPLGQVAESLFVLRGKDAAGLLSELARLRSQTLAFDGKELGTLAWDWRKGSDSTLGAEVCALVAQDLAQLLRLIDVASQIVNGGEAAAARTQDRDRVFYTKPGQRVGGGVAFVFPGAGSQFAEMGRELALHWPEILRAQDRENEFLASQMCSDRFWNAAAGAGVVGTDHRSVICGQVTLGTMVSDLAVSFGIKPEASIGYSLGESTGLFALRAWKSRDEMWRRVSSSPLFARDLTGTPENLRKVWPVPTEQKIEWKAGLVDRSVADVRAAMAGRERIYVLIVNTPNECVIGGDAVEVAALVEKLGCHCFPLEGVSTVHCELLRPVEKPYREMHVFDTVAPDGVCFFSGGWGRSYVPDRETAADAIVAQASDCIDFPRVVRAAYDSGIRIFLEMGPGNSCTRMIGQILEGRPHVARSFCASAQEPVLGVLRALGHLIAEGVSVDLEKVFPLVAASETKLAMGTRYVQIPIASPILAPVTKVVLSTPAAIPAKKVEKVAPVLQPVRPVVAQTAVGADSFEAEFIKAMADAQSATLAAHEAYLNFSQGVFNAMAQSLAEVGADGENGGDVGVFEPVVANQAESQSLLTAAATGKIGKTVALDREACLEFARGSVGKVLGEAFSKVDTFPSRVRLPDEPLMLVDRILEIHGEARSMTHGRVVTEHDIHPGAWYLDCGCIPTCIAVEAGQADLFLSGYLGIDFLTEGHAVYRLLDAKVCFHRGLPGPGAVIHYDIRIDHFFRQGNTRLFRFNFEATVDGEPLLTMTEGCAGFFTAQELAGGKGVVRTTIDLKPMPGKRPADWETFVPMQVESSSNEHLELLRAGKLAQCFGPAFANLPVQHPVTIPSGKMNLVHRIAHLDPSGGRFSLGLIRGEADIHPTDWFLICHFVDDRVMPGTLMFECCLHTLRVFLLRMGWVVEQGSAVLEPVPGVVSQLKCRGQVLESTRVVTYEVSIKELGYRPEPYVIADALMYADGKPIVEITNMSLRYADVTRETLRQTWSLSSETPPWSLSAKPAIYDTHRILAYSIGKPSEAFGAPYAIFDDKRRIARLPGPPYLFLDRITEVTGEPFKMVPGASTEAQYDIPADAWYFAVNRQNDMPFAVLLEIALQPCGWLAAYVGSALTSDIDVSFRNLGGTGKQFVAVDPHTGTLTIRVKLTKVSSSAGMIIQWFDMEVLSDQGLVYKGDTYFGFFPKAALAKQEGIKDAALYRPSDAEQSRAQSLDYPTHAPFADTQLRMVDHIETFIPDGGPKKLGFIRGTKKVVAEDWFFKAHFYQDPVVPGSLGLESFLQLLKYMAVERWEHTDGARWEAVAIDQPHEWVYRGQIIPVDHLVTVEAVVTAIDDETQMITADGFLSVDGRVIYGMKKFTVRAQKR